MKMASLLVVLLASSLNAEEIPLKSVWAAKMPGTRNIRDLEPRTEGDHREFGPLAHTIIRTMQGGRGEGAWGRPDAGPGFPVPGAGIAALHRVYDVIVDDIGQRPKTVPAGEVSIVFFAAEALHTVISKRSNEKERLSHSRTGSTAIEQET